MAKIDPKKGTTSKLIEVVVVDSNNDGLTGLVYNSAGLTAYYYLNDAASSTAITLATMTVGTWVSGGFVEVDATNMPGLYSLGLPNAAVTGADSVVVILKGAASMKETRLEIQLVDNTAKDAVDKWTTAMTESYAAKGATMTPEQAFYEAISLLSEFQISDTTVTHKKRDGSTTAGTSTLDDASNPTSRTRAT